jgi:solute carrier family 13 (sodium-dependent dicarboxylate transporter), member 2/3/5
MTAADIAGAAGKNEARFGAKHLAGILLGPVAAVALWFAHLSPDPQINHALAITAFMVVYWIFEPIDHGITGLIGCYLFWALGVANFETAFSGFADSTPWFLFGAILLGEAASRSGLANRVGTIVMAFAGTSYASVLLNVIVLVLLLNFLIPSGMAQLVILAPIVMGVVNAFGVEKGSRIGCGLFVILTYACGLFNKMILSGGATVLARGLVEKITGHGIPWSEYLVAFLPAIAATVIASWLTILWLYPPERKQLPNDRKSLQERRAALGRWSAAEKRTLALLLLAVALWSTDFIHHIDPAIIALGVGLAVALPGIGILSAKDVRSMNFLLIVFLGAALSMGTVLIHTKALDLLTGNMMSWMTPLLTGTFQSPSVLYWTGFLYHFALGSELSMLSTSLPVIVNYAQSHALNPVALAMVWAFASGGKLFVYQSSVLVQGLAYGYFTSRDMLKVGLALSVAEGIILLFLVPLYWPLIGLSWTASP